MKQKPSLDEAVLVAKKIRQAVTESQTEKTSVDQQLKIVRDDQGGEGDRTTRMKEATVSDELASIPRHAWIRHTIGLKELTSLRLKDAAEAQKKKARYGRLQPEEPSNEQEIADLGIQLALRQLGFADP